VIKGLVAILPVSLQIAGATKPIGVTVVPGRACVVHRLSEFDITERRRLCTRRLTTGCAAAVRSAHSPNPWPGCARAWCRPWKCWKP